MHVYMYPLKIWLNGIVIMEGTLRRRPIRQPVPHPEVAELWDWTMVDILHREFTLWVSTLISNKNIELCSN